MVKKVTQIGDLVLRKKSENIRSELIKSARIKKLIINLTDTMRATGLVGIAAPQIGVNLNIFLVEIRKTKFRKSVSDQSKLQVFINPKIISYSKFQTILTEGCGSIANADLFGPVKRPAKVLVEACNERGQKFSNKYSGLFAKVVQHEFDHLQGILCLDKFTDTRQVANKDNYLKLIRK